MRTILAIALFASLPVLAQQQNSDVASQRIPQPSPGMMQGAIAEVEAQRTLMATRAASLAGQLEEAKSEIERLKKLSGKPCEPKDEKK